MFLYNYGEKTQFINTAIANPLKKKKNYFTINNTFQPNIRDAQFLFKMFVLESFFFIRKKTQNQNLIAKPNCPLAKKVLENNFHLNMFPVLKRWENAN